MSKRFFKSFLSSLLALLMIVSLAAIPSSAASIALSKTSLSLTKGYCTTLKVTGTSSKVTWSTGDKTIATVTSSGKVSGKKVGTTYIYAKVSGKTLKCKVSVVAGKITLGKSSVTMDKGEKTTVTVTALGTHVISAASTNKSVVKATWNGAKFDGNKIKLTLTAIGEGTARVKVYAKNYASTIYKYIDVTVGDDTLLDDDSTDTPITNSKIVATVSSVNVKANESANFYAYSTDINNLVVLSDDISIASASITNKSNDAIAVTVKGIKAGKTNIKIYNKTNIKYYVSIPVTVTAPESYYVLTDVYPNKTGTDLVIQINTAKGKKYMLVPADYDPAYANTMIANQTGIYYYYKLYYEYPAKKLATDTVELVTPYADSINSNQWSIRRYMIKPQNYDQAAVDTAIAEYTKTYKYYTVYNTKPPKSNDYDQYLTWTKYIINPETSKTESQPRYMLVPYGMEESTYATNIKAEDLKDNMFTYYTVLPAYPSISLATDKVNSWISKDGSTKYMLLPANYDYIKRNDVIREDIGAYCYYNWYSTKPTVKNAETEAVIEEYIAYTNGSSVYRYMLVKKGDTNLETLKKRASEFDSNGNVPFNNTVQS